MSERGGRSAAEIGISGVFARANERQAEPRSANSMSITGGRRSGVIIALRGVIVYTRFSMLICCGGPERNGRMTVIAGTPMVTPGALATESYALIDLDRRTVRLERLRDIRPEERLNLRSSVVALDGSVAGWRARE